MTVQTLTSLPVLPVWLVSPSLIYSPKLVSDAGKAVKMPRYSRETTISTIRSFYQFFATLPSLPPEYIWEPPSSGWAEINNVSLSHLGKNKDVIELLKHIPYINDTQIAFQTTVIDYTRSTWCLDKNSNGGDLVPSAAGVMPEYVVALTDGGRCGSWLLLDTRAGISLNRKPGSEIDC